MRVEIAFAYRPDWKGDAYREGFGERPLLGKTSIDIPEVDGDAAPVRWRIRPWWQRDEIELREHGGRFYEPVRTRGASGSSRPVRALIEDGWRPAPDTVNGGFCLALDTSLDVAAGETARMDRAVARMGRPSGMHPLMIGSGDHKRREAEVKADFANLGLIAVDGVVLQKVNKPVLVIDPAGGPTLVVSYATAPLAKVGDGRVFQLEDMDAALARLKEMGGTAPGRPVAVEVEPPAPGMRP